MTQIITFQFKVRNGSVSLKQFFNLLRWFSPLYSYEPYSSQSSDEQKTAWTFEEMNDIFQLEYFFGFLSVEETKRLLIELSAGTYLIRFSSEPGRYTLSVSDFGTVSNWRIDLKKQTNSISLSLTEDQVFSSFRDLVDHFTKHELPGKNLAEKLKLKEPLKRDAKKKQKLNELRTNSSINRLKDSTNAWPPVLDSIKNIKVIGKGAFGIVWLSEWSGKQVAVKEYTGSEGKGEFERELKSLR